MGRRQVRLLQQAEAAQMQKVNRTMERGGYYGIFPIEIFLARNVSLFIDWWIYRSRATCGDKRLWLVKE